MEVEVRVSGQLSTYYGFLLSCLQADYQNATGRSLSLSSIRDGLTYRKKFGARGDQSVDITLHRLIENELYEVFIRSNRGSQLLSYRLSETNNQEIVLTYQEEYIPEGRWQTLNYRLLFPFMKKNLEKRMFLQLKQFAKSAQKEGDVING